MGDLGSSQWSFEVDASRAPMDQRELAALTGNPTHARSSAKRGS